MLRSSDLLFLAGFIFPVGGMIAPAAGEAQVRINSRAAELTITGRVHTQFNTTSVNGERASEFLMRRVRLTGELKINDFVSGKVQPDFGQGTVSLKDAYVRLTFSPAFRTTFGQFKRPFDLFELTSSTQILVVERAGDIRGVDACAGVGGVCSLSRLTEKLQFSDRDIGVLIDGSNATGAFDYSASLTNGTGANAPDENGAKSVTGRVGYEVADDVTIGANFALHDYPDPLFAANAEYATAFGANIEIGDYSEGLHIQAGVVTGDNWRNLVAGQPSSFLAAQGILTFKFLTRNSERVAAVEPVARISWGDPNTDLSGDGGMLFTPGIVVHFTGRNKLGLNLDFWSPSTGLGDLSLKIQSYLHF